MTEPLLTIDRVTGALRLNDQSTPMTGTLSVGRDGTTILRCEPIAFDGANRWLFERAGADDAGFLPWWNLQAHSADGDISSEHLTIHHHTLSPGEQGTTITLEFKAGRMTISNQPPPTAAGCSVTYHTIGMHGMGAQHARAPEGTITLAGAARPENEEQIVGFLKITANEDEHRSLTEWLAACDERTRHTLRIISLADGKNLTWSIRQTKNHGKLCTTELYGSHHASPGHDHIFHHLNLQPVLDLAINNYSPELRATTGIETAIGLFLINSQHVEVLLLIAMTAIEHLTSIYTTHHTVPTPLPKTTFIMIKKALQRTYDLAMKAFTHDPKKVKRVRDNIGRLNETTFHDELARMLQEYGVPTDDIDDSVAKARKARNDIAHRGTTSADFRTFYTHVLVLRELLKRIFLTLLNYDGNYQSFLNGPATLPFPPKKANP